MRDSLGAGAFLGVLTVVAERALTFAALLLVARLLDPERFGLYVYALAGIMPVQVMADQGLETAATSLMARRGRTAATALAVLCAARAALWVLVGLPVALLLLPAFADCPRAVGVAASLGMLFGPSLPYRSLHRARGEMRRVWMIAVADAGSTLVATAAVLLAGGGVAPVFAARAVVAAGVTAWAAGRSALWPRVGPGWRRVGTRLLAVAWPLALNAALLTLMVRTGHLVTMGLLGAQAVGLLGAAARVAEMLSLLAEGVMMAAFPAMAAAPRRAARIARDVAGALGLLVGWGVAVTAAGAAPVVALLYGVDYARAASLLAILSWGAFVSAAGSVIFYRLVVAERERLMLRANLGAAVLAVGMQMVLVLQAGLTGAALGTVLTVMAGQVLLCADAGARHVVLAVWRRVLPAAIAAAGTIAMSGIAGRGWGRAAAAAALFPLIAFAAGLLGPPERQALYGLWTAVRARVAGRGAAG